MKPEQLERVMSIANGNPGSATVLAQLMLAGEHIRDQALIDLAAIDCTPEGIWRGFTEWAGSDLFTFTQGLRERNAELLALMQGRTDGGD
jgi:hypothetical protein